MRQKYKFFFKRLFYYIYGEKFYKRLDYNWEKFKNKYEDICFEQDLVFTDTVIFGLGDEVRHADFNRGINANYRVCVSEWLQC